MKQTKKSFIRLLALCLILSLIAPAAANAAVIEPDAPLVSRYLEDCDPSISSAGFGRIQIHFLVRGAGIMDEIGALSIEVYESSNGTNWTLVKTFSSEAYPVMMTTGTSSYSSSVSYQGVPGRYYKAYVCGWAGKNGSGETGYAWTEVKRAA